MVAKAWGDNFRGWLRDYISGSSVGGWILSLWQDRHHWIGVNIASFSLWRSSFPCGVGWQRNVETVTMARAVKIVLEKCERTALRSSSIDTLLTKDREIRDFFW